MDHAACFVADDGESTTRLQQPRWDCLQASPYRRQSAFPLQNQVVKLIFCPCAGRCEMGNLGDELLPQAVDLHEVLNEDEIFDALMFTSDEATNCFPEKQVNGQDCVRRVIEISRDTRLKKNRAAQKRFRNRQKAKFEEMQHEVATQKDTINRLLAENAVLKNSICLLRKEDQDSGTRSAESDWLPPCKHAISPLSASPVADLGDSTKPNDDFGADRQNTPISKTGLFLRKCWSEFAEEIQGLLAEHEGTQCEETRLQATETLRTSLTRGINLFMRDVLSQSHLLQHCNVTAYEGVDGSTPVPKLKWLSVVQGMGLQKVQMDQIVALKDAFLPRIEATSSNERARLQDLQSFVSNLQSASSFILSADDLDKLNDMTLQVKASIKEKHGCVLEFLLSFFQSDLQPVQMARCIASSYPDYPDICQIAHVASEIRSQISKYELETTQ